MSKIDIISGFLGAGKTTLIKKLLEEALKGEQVVLIENEFGEIGIDGGFLKEAGIQITEMNSGCICCSLVGDFGKALEEVITTYHPDRILIEPSGVGKLSDVIHAVQGVAEHQPVELDAFVTVADAAKAKMYMKNFGEFFNDQIETAACIVFSHTDVTSADKLKTALELVRAHNPAATIVTTAWNDLSGKEILSAMEHAETLETELKKLEEEHEHHCCHGHHDHEEEEHEHHCCHGHHDHEEEEHEHHCCHGHHDHEDEEHDHHCCHGHHDHGHGHHHADEVFTSWGTETGKVFNKSQLEAALGELSNEARFGTVLRAKGIVAGENGKWIHFDYIPGEVNVREGAAAYTGRLCVIGSKISEDELKQLFGV